MRWGLILAALALATPATAQQFDFRGYADFRLVVPGGNERSWLDGGLGKLRYGKGGSGFQFAGAVGEGTLRLTPELSVVGVARVEPEQRTFADVLESYVRYKPVSTTQWRWSVKAGAFFAPMSLENSELGWSPYWTLTPSAINSWFGEELRTFGAEFTLDWRRDEGTLSFTASAYGANDPAGVLMADRGWAMDDRPTGLLDRVRISDATLIRMGDTPPDRTPLFKEFDHRPGWYAGATWSDASQWQVQLFRYDNEADPSAHEDDYFAWRTKFWDAGFSGHLDEFTLLAQAVTGTTEISPSPTFSSITDFRSAYALLGWERDEWRVAVRADLFQTRAHNSFGASPATSEDGHALTAAVSWLPNDWLKLTGEVLAIVSTRGERIVIGLAPDQSETQFQLSARVYLE
ncbi:MAG TPA: hypothetical protein VGG48_04200 [Rhizomicrobium sp.]|jgi:hypothetical protein